MSRHIAEAGFEVRAWNRTRERAEPLAGQGLEILDTPREAASGASILITILSDADAVLETVEGSDGALAGADQATTWLQMSTIGIEGTERCVALAEENGLTLVDAPVVGTKQPDVQSAAGGKAAGRARHGIDDELRVGSRRRAARHESAIAITRRNCERRDRQ